MNSLLGTIQIESNIINRIILISFMKARSSRQTLIPLTGVLTTVMFLVLSSSYSFAETTDAVSLGEGLALEKTMTTMNVPSDNVLPWATVHGTVNSPAQGYPVIIQFFEESNIEEPVHVAQVKVKGDDTYEYKFRVRNVDLDTGIATNIFEGNYIVKIFKVVNSQDNQETL